MKKTILTALLLALAVMLSACSSGIPITPDTSEAALPDGSLSTEAPVGDAGLSSTASVIMYFPSYDGISLGTVEEQVLFSPARSNAESIVRAMLAFDGTGRCDSLGGDVLLYLYGSQPVEVSRNTVNISLGASALRLGRSRLYLVGQAFANTLCQLEDIQYVNISVSGKAVGMDIANSFPMGAFAETDERDINALFQQKLARKAEDDSETKSFLTNVCLYYPLANTEALVCNTQSISFSKQSTESIVLRILSELSLGLENQGVKSPQLPLLKDFVTVVPCIIESEEAGGQVLQLEFAQNLLDMLDIYGVSEESSMASLCKTFCGFLPGLVGIRVSIGGSPTDQTVLPDNKELEERGELYLLSELEIPVYNYAKLYFANDDGELVPSLRPMSCNDCGNPRQLLLELAKGPLEGDSVQNLHAVMPENALTDPMLIGLSVDASTLLVNLSPSFMEIGNAMTAEEEKAFAYAMVNTLAASSSSVSSVAFFCSGEQFDGFSGELYWKGLFYPLQSGAKSTDN